MKIVMPFGRYKGKKIEDVPSPYLEWALREVDRMSPEVQAEMENQLKLRRGEGVAR